MIYDYDLLVIGAGPAGLAAAKKAACYGASVAIIERKGIGGTCVNQGCVVEKLLAYAADFAECNKYANVYGWDKETCVFDWPKFLKAKDKELERLGQIHFDNLKKFGIEYLIGQASFLDNHTLLIDGEKQVSAHKILIAVGSIPLKPEILGINYAISTKDLFNLQLQPKNIAIIGSNYIAVKMAQILNSLGSKVIQIFQEEQIFKDFDNDLAQRVQLGMVKRGIQIFNCTKPDKIELQNDGLELTLNGISKNILKVGAVLNITEHFPNLKDLNLQKIDLQINKRGRIIVNENYQTNHSNIFAIGDCIQKELELTPVATAEGYGFADNQFGNKKQKVNYEFIPIALSYFPEAASIGLSEACAREQLIEPVKCHYKEFNPLFYTFAGCTEKAFIKLVTNSRTERILGIHMIGESAIQIVQTLGPALKLKASLHDFNSLMEIHPSNAEEMFSFF